MSYNYIAPLLTNTLRLRKSRQWAETEGCLFFSFHSLGGAGNTQNRYGFDIRSPVRREGGLPSSGEEDSGPKRGVLPAYTCLPLEPRIPRIAKSLLGRFNAAVVDLAVLIDSFFCCFVPISHTVPTPRSMVADGSCRIEEFRARSHSTRWVSVSEKVSLAEKRER